MVASCCLTICFSFPILLALAYLMLCVTPISILYPIRIWWLEQQLPSCSWRGMSREFQSAAHAKMLTMLWNLPPPYLYEIFIWVHCFNLVFYYIRRYPKGWSNYQPHLFLQLSPSYWSQRWGEWKVRIEGGFTSTCPSPSTQPHWILPSNPQSNQVLFSLQWAWNTKNILRLRPLSKIPPACSHCDLYRM